MVKSCLIAKDDVDISKYNKLIAFLKRNSVGYKAKKSECLTRKQLNKFLLESDDQHYLMMKVAMILGVAGACRGDELVHLLVDNIKDTGSTLIVRLPQTKTKIERTFVVNKNENIELNMVNIYRKYAALRPRNIDHHRFFIQYRNGKCTTQVIGKNTFGKIPSQVATYLGLPNPSSYTGHCLRRTSATLLADAGANITTIKRHGGWKSTAVAEGYIQDSVQIKTVIANQLLMGARLDTETSSSNLPINNTASSSNLSVNEVVSSSELATEEVNTNLLPKMSFDNCSNCSFVININK